ncbi:hypothetical protein VTN96DRAFT_9000 [Rasamsonia emersonii]|uniref:peptidylprolyl isomerase n=1 Tax=Rasamsonia emersonii (strain ATCC 16479 / CBS 393.64 / IMI 116815) TaxID=1408163 RepID=A0A0F4YWY9_RASE3|nr:Peptidylprolyl isomerase [Rasamsonia emersonii CBS 393.64]KKA22123.1 Peptidylprolyl isomerase [Rasamsonia emersonii CBS 393.64]
MSVEEQGWAKTTLKPGNGEDFPRVGDQVRIAYTGWLRDPSNSADYEKGREFDSSRKRGPLQTEIGVGRVIKGWDEGVRAMSLGEKSILTINSRYAYGERGFPNVIPPNSDLVFEVELLGINNKSV